MIFLKFKIQISTTHSSYHYDATPDEAGGTIITMNEGDELLLLERDMGDGWTRVRHRISNAEGFVPTSYLVNFRQKYKKCYTNKLGW